MVSQFMEVGDKELTKKQLIRLSVILGVVGVFVLIFGGEMSGLGSLMLVTAVMFWVYKYVLKKMAVRFQNGLLVRMEEAYERSLRFCP